MNTSMKQSINWGAMTILIMIGSLLVNSSQAQVDPAWLRSWNEAKQQQPKQVPTDGSIAHHSEPGITLVINGVIEQPDGSPAADVLIHAYHRDHEGFELGHNDAEFSTWDLNGWAKTDDNGKFSFHTIRPAVDHLGREAAHIHFTLSSEQYGKQWAPKVYFSDDALLSADQRQASDQMGRYGSVRKVQVKDGVQHIDVTLQLKPEADF